MNKIIHNKVFKITIFVIAVLMVFQMNIAAEQDANITQLLKDFQVENNPIDDSIINGNTYIMADEMDTLDNSLITILTEPSVSENYDKICPLFEKSNISGVQMFLDGQFIEFSKYDNVTPTVLDGRVLVPFRAIAENLGAKVEWVDKDKLIRMKLNDKVVELVLDKKTALVNGRKVTLDTPAKMINGRTLVPARFIGESFSKKVEWHSYNKTLGVIAIY